MRPEDKAENEDWVSWEEATKQADRLAAKHKPAKWYRFTEDVYKAGGIFVEGEIPKSTLLPVIGPGELYPKFVGGWAEIFDSIGRTIHNGYNHRSRLLDITLYDGESASGPAVKCRLVFQQGGLDDEQRHYGNEQRHYDNRRLRRKHRKH